MPSKTFYLSTTLPYVNAAPHIGFALEIVAADVIARYQRLLGKEVIFNTGTDEHGQKIYQEALKNNQDPQAYSDEYAVKFDDLKNELNLSYDHFIRTTDPDHQAVAQEFWRRCDTNGYIYKSKYKNKYCVGCELEKTDSDLENGKCPLHPNRELEIREEENYFFKFSAFQKQLLDLYKKNPKFIKPTSKQKEITNFIKQGLKDFSVSRLKEKMPWGVPVPNDPDHVMYVWFDALVNYISTLGWPKDQENFKKFWPVVQLAGKDNLRQQSAMWQAMLMAADLPNSKQILINGFIGVDGQKMSKSLGNVIAPSELVERYSVDGARYLIINLGPFGEDMDVSWKKFDTVYTADLANGLGNLCSRVAKLCEKNGISVNEESSLNTEFNKLMDNYDLSDGLNWIASIVAGTDKYLSETQPWKKEGNEQKEILTKAIQKIQIIAYHLQPFMPETADTILNHFSQLKITALTPLFPRLT
ncbi:methionine--tRNA ligase [Patescibacteria group bacterium]|nr:methionine--tRNA ligase [Patescibacteria group bacterium]